MNDNAWYMTGVWVTGFSAFLGLIFPLILHAHPGRTDSSGCHTCRTNCPNWGLSTGEYHCHNAKTLPQPKEPIKSIYGENGTGSVSPAPEYKAPKVVTPKETSTIINTKTPEKGSWFSGLFSWFK